MASTGNPSLISLDLPNYRDGSSGGTAQVPFGHAGVIINDGDGNGTYYEWGLYSQTQTGVVTINPGAAVAAEILDGRGYLLPSVATDKMQAQRFE